MGCGVVLLVGWLFVVGMALVWGGGVVVLLVLLVVVVMMMVPTCELHK